MIGAQMDDWDGSKIRAIPAADLDRIFSLMMPVHADGRRHEPPRGPGDPLRDADLPLPPRPGLLRQADQRRRLEGPRRGLREPAAVDRADPPPREVPRPSPTRRRPSTSARSTPGEGWKEVGRNVVGEMQLGVLLRRHGGKAAAAGWDGDRFAVFEGPDGKLGLVWLTTWDTEDDAREFARQYARFQTTKLGEGVEPPDAFPDAIRRPHAGTVYAVERRGKDVAVVEGFAAEATERLLEAAFQAEEDRAGADPEEVSRTADGRSADRSSPIGRSPRSGPLPGRVAVDPVEVGRAVAGRSRARPRGPPRGRSASPRLS